MLAALVLAALWVRDGQPTPQAQALVRVLAQARDKGLDPADYALEGDDLDAALTRAAELYAGDLFHGRVDPRSVGADIDRPPFDAPAFARALAEAQDVEAELGSLEPAFPLYQRMLRALREYQRIAALEHLPLPAAGPKPISPGAEWEGVPRLARLLELTGDLAPDVEAGPLYAGPLVTAVIRFQLRHGLPDTGVIDRRTLRALQVPLARRALQLELSLERIRWMPRRFETPPVVVNIPEFRLRAGPFSMKVVVGRAYRHRTPMFIGEIRGVLFRPPWNVPLTIVRDELLGELAQEPGKFDTLGFELRARDGAPAAGDLRSEETRAALRSGEILLRQKPGPSNALGLVKFVMPNRHAVYLHGTPAQKLFVRQRRDFSHGCIRVEDPQALAQWLLRWTAEQAGAAMTGESTVEVALPRPVPVLIVYGTALVRDDGEVRFTEDIYRLDAQLETALQARRAPPAG